MAFIADRIVNNLNRESIEHFTQALDDLESLVGAPVRALQPNAGRTVTAYTQAWSGNSAIMTKYPGFTEQDRDERGVTLLFSSWNSEIWTGRARYTYQWVPTNMWPDRANQLDALEWEFHMPEEINPEGCMSNGGEPQVFSTIHGDTMYGEIYEGRVMFIFFPAQWPYSWGGWEWERIFAPLLAHASPEALEAARERMAARNQELFLEIMQDQGNVVIQDLRARGAAIQRQIGQAQEDLVNLTTDARNIGNQLQYILQQEGEVTPEALRNEWESLERNVNIERFMLGKRNLDNPQRNENRRQRERREREEREGVVNPNPQVGYLKLYTPLLYITNPENGREMPLGKFELTLDFSRNSLRITNLTHRQEGRWDHPHVSEGELCAADYRTTITTMLRQRQIAPMANLCFSILSTVTLEDPWGRNGIERWEAADDRWRQENGHPAWTRDEEMHPLKAEAAQAGEATTDEDGTEPGATPEQPDDTGTEPQEDAGDGDPDDDDDVGDDDE